jgi:DNA-directed RNA polymerase subunit L
VFGFRSEFIASHTKAGATNGMIKTIKALQEACEDSNEDVKSLIEDMDKFIEDAISSDGRGQFLSSYDSNEVEIVIDGETFYSYRLN